MKQKSIKGKSVVAGVLEYLSLEKDANLLSEITAGLENELAKVKRTDEIVITSAVKLTSSQLQKIKTILQKKLKVSFPVKNIVDQNLIAGFTIAVNDWYLDASVTREMDQIKQFLLS